MSKLKKWLSVIAGCLAVLALVGFLAARWYMGVLFAPLDHTAPEVPTLQRPAVLVFDKANGFIHREARPKAKAVLGKIASDAGWSIYQTDNGAVMSPKILQHFDAVVWNNTSGTTLTEEQQQAFREYMEGGGGFVGLHAAGGDPWYQWPWYRDTLIGAAFVGHTMSPQFQQADVLAPSKNELTSHLPTPWRVEDEWYAFDHNPRDDGFEILLALDESSYEPGSTSMPGEHPIAWRHEVGQGRAVYSAIGHQAAGYDSPEYQRFIEQAIRWAGRLAE